MGEEVTEVGKHSLFLVLGRVELTFQCFFTDMGTKESYGSSAIIMNVTFSKIKLRKGKLK